MWIWEDNSKKIKEKPKTREENLITIKKNCIAIKKNKETLITLENHGKNKVNCWVK